MSIAAAACSQDKAQEYDLWVGPQQVDCVGAFKQKCLMVRRSPTEAWQLFYSSIEGYDYQPGYTYHIRVRETEVKDPAMDASSRRYVLLELIEKTPAMSAGARTSNLRSAGGR